MLCLSQLVFVVFSLLSLSLTAATKRKDGLSDIHAKWLNEDVVYIITDEERKEFIKLAGDAAKDKFIEEFWEIRNPQRGTRSNPFKEEHYRRIAYANQTFGHRSNTPGWMTDQGRTWILFGKPVSRAIFTGYGQIYPLELWFYENSTSNPALPSFFNLMFYMPEDIGEYRFYRPSFDTPMKLVRGSQFRTNRDVYNFLKPLGGDVARASLCLIPGEPIDTTDYNPSMGSDMLVNKITNLANDSFNVSRIRQLRTLNASVTSVFLATDQRPMEINSIVLCDPAGQLWLDYAALIDRENMGVVDAGGQRMQISFSYRLTNEAGDLIVEDSQDRAYPAFQGKDAERRFVPFQIAGRLPLVPGKYKLEVQTANRPQNKMFRGEKKLVVERPGQVMLQGPLLISGIVRTDKPDPMMPFQYFGIQFQPSSMRRYTNTTPMRALFQLQVPTPDINYQIQYVVAHTVLRDARSTFTDDVSPAQLKDGRLLNAKTFALEGLPDGEYRLVVNLRAGGVQEILASASVPFRIGEQNSDAELFTLSSARQTSSPAVAAYIRGLASMAQKDETGATKYFRQAFDQNPANSFAGSYLLRLYFTSKSFDEIVKLYDKLGLEPFKGSADSLARISISYWQVGQKQKAKDLLAAARQVYPKDASLESVAKRLQ